MKLAVSSDILVYCIICPDKAVGSDKSAAPALSRCDARENYLPWPNYTRAPSPRDWGRMKREGKFIVVRSPSLASSVV